MVNVRCALRLRCRGPRAGRPGGRAPGSAPRARAPGSVSSPVAPLSLSRPAGLSPRGRHGLQAEATRPRTRLLLLRRPSSRSPRRGTTPWEPRFPSGALWVGGRGPPGPGGPVALEIHADCAGRAWRQGIGLVPPHAWHGEVGVRLSSGGWASELGRRWRGVRSPRVKAGGAPGTLPPRSRAGAREAAPRLQPVSRASTRRWPGTPDPREASAAHRGTPSSPAPRNLGTPAPLEPPEPWHPRKPRTPGTPEPPFLRGLRTRAHVFPAE